ncbi:hypothetical protein HDR59_02110 [bacterium]|nr:hypothetical protein [bacterium]
MNKKILTSAVVLSGLLFGGNVFAADYINIEGEGICEMVLPANAKKEENNFEFSVDKNWFFDQETGETYVGFDNLLKNIHNVLPDAVITSYKYYDGYMFFNIDTKLQKDLIGLVGVEYATSGMDEGIKYDLTDEFKSSKEFLDCKDMAIKSAMKNAMDKAKILKAKIVYTPNYGYDKVYKIEDGKIRYYSNINYRAVAD